MNIDELTGFRLYTLISMAVLQHFDTIPREDLTVSRLTDFILSAYHIKPAEQDRANLELRILRNLKKMDQYGMLIQLEEALTTVKTKIFIIKPSLA